MTSPWLCRRRCLPILGLAALGFAASALAADPLPELIDKIKPSVVAVGFFKETNSPRFTFRGTGFVVGDGNLLITNAHVVERLADSSQDGNLVVSTREVPGQLRIRRADLVEVDKTHDLALLRFEGTTLPHLDLAKSASAREGQRVAFVGFPLGGVLGFSPVTHRGTISSLTSVALPSPSARQLDDKAISRIRAGTFEMLQLDATAYPGNSGGPLFDEETGEVLGVVNMVTLKGTRESALTHPSGISYAVPVAFVKQLLAHAERK
jgi:S1-C subfamily serine protease